MDLGHQIANGDIIYQTISMFVILFIIILQIQQLRISKNNINWIVPIMIWMVHGFIFYLALNLDRFTTFTLPWGITYTRWSAVLRLHGYVTIALMEYVRYIGAKRRGKK